MDLMTFTKHPRLFARIGGAFYVVIIVFAMFAYRHVRGELFNPADMARTAANIVSHERLYRLGFSAAVVVVICNLPMGWVCFELLKAVAPRLALLALLFLAASTTIEAVNLFNYVSPLFTFTLPEYGRAFDAVQQQALARGAMKLFSYGFTVALAFFAEFCLIVGYLILRSRFLPRMLGLLMIAAGLYRLVDAFSVFLSLPDIPYIGWTGLIAESALALWLLVFGVNEAEWREQAQATAAGQWRIGLGEV